MRQTFILVVDEATTRRKRAITFGEEIEVDSAAADETAGKEYVYNITDLEPSRKYAVSLEASNDLGRSGKAEIEFGTEPFPVTVNYFDDFCFDDCISITFTIFFYLRTSRSRLHVSQ